MDDGTDFQLEPLLFFPACPPTITKEKIIELNLSSKEIEKLLKKSSLLTDITSLLPLPQKIAAAKLGISESMLCKRFKERTNKKWPHRYLKKIERDIENANTEEEKQNLLKMRDEYLAPVSIQVRRYRTQKEITEFTCFDPEEKEN
jgi:DNA-binding Lrp family transcriptional regulator